MRNAVPYDVGEDGLDASGEALHGDDHQYESHETHHHVVSGFADDFHKACRLLENEICQYVDKRYDADERQLQIPRFGIVHEHDAVCNGAGAAEHWD